jgi:hypothetical protein
VRWRTTLLEVHRDHQHAGIGPITLVSADHELDAAGLAEGLIVEDRLMAHFPDIEIGTTG